VTKYSERIDDADFPAAVATARQRMAEIPAKDRELLAERGEPELLERIDTLMDRLLVVTASVPPEAVSERYIRDLQDKLEAVFERLGGMHPDPHPNDITLLISATEALAEELAAWPATTSEDRTTQAASTYRRSIGQQLATVRTELDELASAAEVARADLAAAREEDERKRHEAVDGVTTTLANLTRQADAFEARLESLGSQAEQAQGRTDAAIARFEGQFSESEATRRAEAQAQAQAMTKRLEEIVSKLDVEADDAIAGIQAQEAKAGDMVSAFAAAGTANAYGKEAKEQAGIANNWRLLAVVLATAAVLIALALLVFEDKKHTAAEAIGRAAVVLALGGVAGYAARQSARHRRREEVARHRELDIVVFGPFIRDLPEDKQTDARMQLVGRTFGQDLSTAPTSGTSVGLTDEDINLISKLGDVFIKQLRR
jgi:hypothetical protein